MELSFITRGCKRDVDDFIMQLQGKYLPLPIHDKDGKLKETASIQLLLKPIQLWEVAFPKEQLDIVCNTILGDNRGRPEKKDQNLNKWLFPLRKIMRAKPIPKYDTTRFLPTGRQNIQIIGIGIREDGVNKYPNGDTFEGI